MSTPPLGKDGSTLPVPNILTAKLAIMKVVPYVRKTQPEQGKGLKYSYASEQAFIMRLRPAMIAEGVTIAPIETQAVDTQTMSTKGGGTMLCRSLIVRYRFTHVESGTFEDVQVFGEGADPLDKAGPKAMTQALKYALRQWLLIETGDDPDRIQEVDAAHLSASAQTALEAIRQAETPEQYASVEKRIAASSNIGAAERGYLTEALQAARASDEDPAPPLEQDWDKPPQTDDPAFEPYIAELQAAASSDAVDEVCRQWKGRMLATAYPELERLATAYKARPRAKEPNG